MTDSADPILLCAPHVTHSDTDYYAVRFPDQIVPSSRVTCDATQQPIDVTRRSDVAPPERRWSAE